MKKHLATALLCMLPLLAACGQDNNAAQGAADASRKTTSELRGRMQEVREKVRTEIQSEDIELDAKGADKDAPEARITPAGDFYVGDRQIEIDDAQRALLLKYRGHVAEVGAAGAEIGLQAAELATDAVGEAIKGIFTGDSEQDIEKRLENDIEGKIKASVTQLCQQLPPMLETQQALVESLPEFVPYADMDQGDIDDCMDEGKVDI
ncbi:hypothetical protein FKV24_005480 [Lysobacter maris]|uniref:DUF2884 family protein n=1 Tax=Marilutibacter maris TaxID=1605891 RepID=A0A508AYD3_9GAMM|nr:hypothetical protein [Lysobacter maris]KAB8195006.1 hypothetical protein FKV24_005480 [Lysobacter maris]